MSFLPGVEQAPNPDSRVTLDTERDSLRNAESCTTLGINGPRET